MRAETLRHPGDIVRNLIEETGLTVAAAAARLHVSRQQLTRLIGRKSDLSPEMALRIESVFGPSAEELMQRQTAFDLAEARAGESAELDRLEPFEGPLKKRNRHYVMARLRARRQELEALGARHLYLFGSVARGEAGAASDIDLYYEDAPQRRVGLNELSALEARIREILDVDKIDLVPGDSFRPKIKERIAHDTVKIF
ncbi:MAG TPA: HigA family addiction module antitoxin [Parvularculaceae bacterium]|nr:HigA family addiction module antitoxin [Parvularculaceae bacterium]